MPPTRPRPPPSSSTRPTLPGCTKVDRFQPAQARPGEGGSHGRYVCVHPPQTRTRAPRPPPCAPIPRQVKRRQPLLLPGPARRRFLGQSTPASGGRGARGGQHGVVWSTCPPPLFLPPPPLLLPAIAAQPSARQSLHFPSSPPPIPAASGVLSAALAAPALPSVCLRDRRATRDPLVWRGTPATSAPTPPPSAHPSYGPTATPPPRDSADAGSFEGAGEARPAGLTSPSIPWWGGTRPPSRLADLRSDTPFAVFTPARYLGPPLQTPPSSSPPCQPRRPHHPAAEPHSCSDPAAAPFSTGATARPPPRLCWPLLLRASSGYLLPARRSHCPGSRYSRVLPSSIAHGSTCSLRRLASATASP